MQKFWTVLELAGKISDFELATFPFIGHYFLMWNFLPNFALKFHTLPMITAKIQVEPYVAEYITGKYYSPDDGAVHFPPSLDIYVTIYDLMAKRPDGVGTDTGNLCFCLPDRREANKRCGKSPEQYNYFSDRSVKILEKRMRVMMWAELHDFMDENKHLRGVRFIDSVFTFMKRYDINSISEDAMLKNYQRWRDNLRRSKKRAYKKQKKSS